LRFDEQDVGVRQMRRCLGRSTRQPRHDAAIASSSSGVTFRLIHLVESRIE
jgi:hypothetical protein